MKIRVIISLTLAVAVCVVADACAGSPVSEESGGCGMDLHGVAGVIRPESSDLTCETIKDDLLDAIPSKPQSFVIIGSSPHLLWKCQLYAAKTHPVLLQCSHHRKHFSVVKSNN